MSRQRRVLTSLLATVLLLVPATVAWSASGTLYKGKTGQKRKIRFTVSSGEVVGMKFAIDEKCPDGHILTESITISSSTPIPIKNSRFGGKFVPKVNPHNEHTNIKGKLTGNKAKGSISATNYSTREHRLCTGKTKFKAKA